MADAAGKGRAAARKVRVEEAGYFARNQERMDYARYARAGLPIGGQLTAPRFADRTTLRIAGLIAGAVAVAATPTPTAR